MESAAIKTNNGALCDKCRHDSRKPGQGDDSSFSKMLGQAVDGVNEQLVAAANASAKMAAGKEVDITQTMIDITKADLSFKLLLQIRNKALSAYEEIMRMQL